MKSVFAFFAMFLLLPLAKPEVSANAGQTTSQQQTEKNQLQERNAILETVGKAAYFLIWPLVALAGLAMDNNLVYGSFMYLDAPLWKIWTIVRNLATLTLWFIFLLWVLAFAIDPERKVWWFLKGIGKPQDLIKKAVIAGVLIQASWFIMMVLVDVSTIMTYTVGTIPQSILPSVDQKADYKVMGMSIAVDWGDAGTGALQDQNSTMKFYRTLANGASWEKSSTLIAPCEVITRKDSNADYIIGRKFDTIGTGQMKEGYCVLWGTLVAYKEWNWSSDIAIVDGKGFAARLNDAKEKLPDPSKVDAAKFKGYVEAGYIVKAANSTSQAQNNDGCRVWWVANTPRKSVNQGESEYDCIFKNNGLKVSELLTKAKSWTGPFVSLYSSMLDFASFQNNNLGLSQKFIVFLINTAFALVLLLPLVALVAVLFWRVVQLRIAIALSPFLVLKHSFKEMFGSFFENIDGLNLSELIKLLFAPVMIGFAVSIAMMFMTILKTSLAPSIENLYVEAGKNQELSADQKKRNAEYAKRIKDITGIEFKGEGDNQELEILGFIKISIKAGLMNFSWFLVQIFGLAISRFLLFAAIKSTKIGKSVGKSLQAFGEKALATSPIIPVGKDGISFAWAQGAVNKVFTDINSKFDDQRNTEVQALLWDATAKDKMMARDFFNGTKISYDFSTASQSEDKIRLLSTFANIAGDNVEKNGKVANAYESFFTALNSQWSGLSDKERVQSLMNLLNSEGMKKIGKADAYYAKFGQNIPKYIEEEQDSKDPNKKKQKKMVLKLNPQNKAYEIVEEDDSKKE